MPAGCVNARQGNIAPQISMHALFDHLGGVRRSGLPPLLTLAFGSPLYRWVTVSTPHYRLRRIVHWVPDLFRCSRVLASDAPALSASAVERSAQHSHMQEFQCWC